jgi:Ethanolamine utilization protein EutJ (predicted chaperonin)|tara:strand:- start:590 stop:922 length:333 start_codon:yes stop_codon:yes gene_type:complete
MDKIKNQLAGVAALLGVIAAIGGGFIKYGEIVTKLDAIEAREVVNVDTSGIEMSLAVVEEKVNKLENADTSHSHEQEEHSHTVSLVNKKEIEIIKVQIEEIKAKASNPLQ